jgi:hypothetical protein
MRRVVLPLAALLLATGAEAPPTVEVRPGPLPEALAGEAGSSAVCRDRIQEVRREFGRPELRDAPAEDPLFIAAVDKRIGGCSVMVMRGDTSDLRPLPAAREHRLMPAR